MLSMGCDSWGSRAVTVANQITGNSEIDPWISGWTNPWRSENRFVRLFSSVTLHPRANDHELQLQIYVNDHRVASAI